MLCNRPIPLDKSKHLCSAVVWSAKRAKSAIIHSFCLVSLGLVISNRANIVLILDTSKRLNITSSGLGRDQLFKKNSED